MDVKTRVQLCRLIEKINANPEYAKRIKVVSTNESQYIKCADN